MPRFLLACASALALLAPAHALAADRNTDRPVVVHRFDGRMIRDDRIEDIAEDLMAKGKIPGLAIAVINDGRVAYVSAWGERDREKALPLETDTIMYGASLTKTAFAYMVMQLVDEGVIDLDAPIERYLKKPLPAYDRYADLAADTRWARLTPRMLLSHSAGFPNFRSLNPDGKLDFKFEPGTRYAYSGEGINLLQFVLETGLGLDVGKEMQKRVFDRFGMSRTSMTWRDDFADNLTTGYDETGKAEPHDAGETVKAAGSLDTTITDYARFLAGLARGEGLSDKAHDEMLSPQIAITSQHQFPTLDPAIEPANRKIALAGGLGVVVFKGPYGATWFKGGHNDTTDNQVVCVEGQKRCILLMTNSGVGQRIFPALVKQIMGEPGVPWSWEYSRDLPVEPQIAPPLSSTTLPSGS